uniref:Secreted protein n=1 Tax=Trichogramma kaykai TaxID=54128 RepID=A0ABD2XDX1_9HYME
MRTRVAQTNILLLLFLYRTRPPSTAVWYTCSTAAYKSAPVHTSIKEINLKRVMDSCFEYMHTRLRIFRCRPFRLTKSNAG